MKKINISVPIFFSNMKLLDSVIIVVLSLIIFLLVSVSIVFSNMIFNFIQNQTEKTAIQSAKNISSLPQIKNISSHEDRLSLYEIESLITDISINTNASFIYILDKNTNLLVKSKSDKNINHYENPYMDLSLEKGQSYVYRFSIDSERFITGISPIHNELNEITGVVVVGFPINNTILITRGYFERNIFYLFLFIIVGLGASIVIARGVKNAIFGLEPQEIASLFQARTAIIESIRAGVLATDAHGKIHLSNSKAEEMLGLTKNELAGASIEKFFPVELAVQALRMGVSIYDAEETVQGIDMYCNMVPLDYENINQGVVVTFRQKDEIDFLTRELSQTTRYSEILRAQTHEYANRLHAIAGMIQTKDYDDVLDFIASETVDHKVMVRTMTETVEEPTLRSLLIGKYMHAKELRIDFSVDPESSMRNIPPSVSRHYLLTILGNLIENAFEACKLSTRQPKVTLSMSDFGDLIFEVEDSGPGVPEAMVEKIFERGVSTKQSADNGVGLFLVRQALLDMKGSVSIEKSELGGARFVVIIPTLSESQS